ncbi:MAG: hypothetical protein U5K43_05960 [Halofilum sp. (in: g-proteobacteria)]|nr:hypothetical protein [Halofilum sp. (in: g-proteobacteria)]
MGQQFRGKFVGSNEKALIIRFDVQDTIGGDTIAGIQILQERPPG